MTRTALTPVDADTAMLVLEIALNQSKAVRRDSKWTRSSDAAERHDFGLRDMERTLIHRCDRLTAMVIRGAIRGEREAFAAR